MSLLFRGGLTASSHMVLQPALAQVLAKNVSLTVGAIQTTTPDYIDVFGRLYDSGNSSNLYYLIYCHLHTKCNYITQK